MEFIAWPLLGGSVAANIWLYFMAFRRKRTPNQRLDLTAQDLLHDLTRRGTAILKVDVIDPANLMLRSPRS